MSEFAGPAIYAALVWWFTTGVILFLNGLPARTFRWSMGAATAGLLGAPYLLHGSAVDVSANGAYAAFTGAIGVWGWLEMSFLMGYITGPRRQGCMERCGGWSHFVHATQAILYNELATLLLALLLAGMTWKDPNRLALETFLILWGMRVSAKLNLFFGVPNLGEKFLPPHLSYLKYFFRKRPMNLLFPVSISLATWVTIVMAQKALSATDAFNATSHALMSALLALGLLEHWFMVVPLPSEKLWHWALGGSGRSRNGASIDAGLPKAPHI